MAAASTNSSAGGAVVALNDIELSTLESPPPMSVGLETQGKSLGKQLPSTRSSAAASTVGAVVATGVNPQQGVSHELQPDSKFDPEAAERQRMQLVNDLGRCWSWFMVLTFMAIAAFVLEQELTAARVFCSNLPEVPCDFTVVANSSHAIWPALLFLQIIFSTCTVASCFFIFRAYYIRHITEIRGAGGKLAAVSFLGDADAINPLFLRSLLEASLVLLHIPPGLFQTFVMVDMFDTSITYSVRVCNVVVFFRLAFTAYYIDALSPFEHSTGHVATVLYSRPSSMTALKKLISDNPIPPID